MGKKGNKRKTRWRVLPIGDDGGVCSGNEDDGDMERDSASPNGSYARVANGGQQRLLRGVRGRPHPRHRPYHDNGQPLVTTEKKTFNEEEYTKITTPRQDVLFKKGYLGRKRPTPAPDNNTAPAAAPADVTNGNLRPDGSAVQNGEPLDNDQGYEVITPDEQPQIIYTNGYVDQSGIYYINGGYELYDPYSGGVTVVVGPAPHFAGPGGGPPVLAAVPCQPLPLQPLEWFNPAFVPYVPAPPPPPLHDPNKRFSIDSQNCSPQSSESTGPPGSPQECCEDGLEHPAMTYQPQGHPTNAPPPPHPTYVYPGYMFGPPVYNMNGVTVQGAPPQPPPGDAAAASKRRKKKRRRRRRRGGAEDGSEESSSEEKELEEPMSITSQESSSQELESDSKQSPTVEQDAVVLAAQETNVLPLQADQEKTIFVCSAENTDIKPVASQQGLTKTDCERQEWRIGSGDTPLVNGVSHSDSSDNSCRAEVPQKVSTPQLRPLSPQTPLQPPTPPPTPTQTPSPAETARESLPNTEINGYSSDAVIERANKSKALEKNPVNASSPSHIETLNNVANKLKSGKSLTDQKKKQESKKSNNKNACNGNVNGKQAGGKVRKDNRQRNLQNGYLPNITSKMDGNENVGRCRDQMEKSPRAKNAASLAKQSSCINHDSASKDCIVQTSKTEESSGRILPSPKDVKHTFVPEKTEKNEPPNKPVRKDLCKAIKLKSSSPDHIQNDQTGTVAECLEDAVVADKSETEHGDDVTQVGVQCSSTAELAHVGEHTDTAPAQDVSKESLKVLVSPVEQLGTTHTSDNVKQESKDFRLCESSSPAQVQEEKHIPSVYAGNFTSGVNVSSTEDEREAEPPPIPPPRKKRWRTSVRRQSLERAPTPGRELEVCAGIAESISDESSLSSSTQSEESVIELLSSMPTSPDVEAKTRSSEDDDLIYARKHLHQFENPEDFQPTVYDKSYRMCMSSTEIEKYAETLSQTLISEAVEDAVLEYSKNARPITHAVTRWLRSQSPEEVLSLPSRDNSESEIDDTDVSGGSTEDIADVRQEMQTGPKNVHRNPLLASSLKISCKLKNSSDGVSRRVAKKTGYQTKNEIKTVTDATKKITQNLEGCNDIFYETTEGTKLPKKKSCSGSMSKVQMYIADDESFLSDMSECEGEWDLWDCRSMKPSSLTVVSNKVDELSLTTVSPDDRRMTMCDPTLSVAKYYSLGAVVKSAAEPKENSDTKSESGSEQEVDALYHFRNEIENAQLQHAMLASELACSYKPLPEHWAVDPVVVICEKIKDPTFEKKYLPDSGVQSEESGDEVTIGSNARQINLKANLLHHQSAILMNQLHGDGPFPCGGICCILQ